MSDCYDTARHMLLVKEWPLQTNRHIDRRHKIMYAISPATYIYRSTRANVVSVVTSPFKSHKTGCGF